MYVYQNHHLKLRQYYMPITSQQSWGKNINTIDLVLINNGNFSQFWTLEV